MIGNIAILIFSSIFICIIAIYLYTKWPDLDVIDLYIIFVLLHFGFYPFIRGLYFGKDIIFDFRNADPLALGLVFAQVLIILLIIRGISLYFPATIANYLKIGYLIEQWAKINKYLLLLIYLCLVIFPIVSYYKYGVRTYILPEDFEKIGKNLPYWFTSIRTAYVSIAFCIFLGLFSKIAKSTKPQQIVWIILTVIFVPIVTIYGRRYFLNMIAMAAILWLAYKKINIFRIKYLSIGLLLIGVFFLFSNMYQSYRDTLFTVGKVNLSKLQNPVSAALNFNSTINNLKYRAGTWEFNFLVFNNQVNKSGMATNGKITYEGFKSCIPRFFWPEKHFTLIDDILVGLCQVTYREVFTGKNLFGIAQVEFGYYSLLIMPAIILLIIIIMAWSTSLSLKYPYFLLMFNGLIIDFLINIEENGNMIFLMLRNIFLLFILFGLYVCSFKIYSSLLHYKKNKE
jgi:hypothetical protein